MSSEKVTNDLKAEGEDKFENPKKSTNRHSNHMNFRQFDFNQFSNQMDGPLELQRQRSFVLPGQLQKEKKRTQANSQRGGKPAMEIYRPPKSHNKSMNGYQGNNTRPGLNIHAKEFIASFEPSSIRHSKSSGNIMVAQNQSKAKLQHSKSGFNLRGTMTEADSAPVSTAPRVHFLDNKENHPDAKNDLSRNSMMGLPTSMGSGAPVKRSKSLGSADIRCALIGDRSPLSDIGPFAQDVQNTISKAMNDPNSFNARQLMEVIRHVFTRVVEASRYAEPTARLCIAIVEKEKGETFLETLLNTCQEYFHERDRLLRSATQGGYPGHIASHPRWIAYMSFLNEMYTQLKRRHVKLMTERMQNSETPPGLLLLSLLAQCCNVCLREQAVNSLAEMECLFFVLTAVGKDIEVELPHQMARVMGSARDAFLTKVHVPAVRKTLLQLIELHAARWQLPASAVMYYYPGSGAKC